MLSCHILWLLLFQSLATTSSSEHYHIVPVDSIDKCLNYQNETCFTLKQLIQTNLLSSGDNLTLNFLPGEHVLTGEFVIQNFSHVLIAGFDTTVVNFHGNSSIKLSSLTKLYIKDISFIETDIMKETLTEFQSHNLENSKLLITDTQTAVIEHILFVNNSARALYVEAENLHVANSEFTANNGGAVHIMSSGAIISNTTFSNNRAEKAGGALVLDSQDVIITKCSFSNNTVYKGDGGAIYVVNRKAYISDSTLTNNITYKGGGVSFGSSKIHISISNSTLTNDGAGSFGGVFRTSSRSNVSISNSILTNNSADHGGGVIHAHSSNVFISNSTLTNNGAKLGGVIHAYSSSVSISNSTLTNNSVNQRGGVIHTHSRCNVSISNCILRNNGAKYGGVIYAHKGKVFISNGTLADNSADLKGGVISVHSSKVSISSSTLINNSVNQKGGVIHTYQRCNVFISNSTLTNNGAKLGGVIRAYSSSVSISNSTLTDNSAHLKGGVIFAVSILNSTLTNNSVNQRGGVIHTHSRCNVSISNCILRNNGAKYGGVIHAHKGDVFISNSTLADNSADLRGGVISVHSSKVSISSSTLINNSVNQKGGVIHIYQRCNVSISNSTLTNNGAKLGGVIHVYSSKVSISSSTLTNNSAHLNGGVIIAGLSKLTLYSTRIIKNTVKLDDAVLLLRLCTTTFHGVNISDNKGHIDAFAGKVKFNGQIVLSNNSGLLGGAISAERSDVYFNSTERILITNNTAISGGGIFLRESALFVHHDTEISLNTAKFGGGIHAQSSKIEIEGPTPKSCAVITIAHNAAQSGGSIYAMSSTITASQFHIYINSNTAEVNGGGMYLEKNSNIYLLKRKQETFAYDNILLQLNNNSAQYGGGIFVADDTEGGAACGENHKNSGECFIQTIKMYYGNLYQNTFNTFMTNNTAKSGGDIFGGLFDRCIASQLAEVNNLRGIDYIRKTVASSEWHSLSISSKPVQVLFCNSSKNISVRKGDTLRVSVMAVDQVGNPVNATIHSSVVTKSGVGRLKEGQAEQTVGNQCKEIEYNVFSRDSSAQVELYAEGPCGNLGISKQTMNITFLPCSCPIGLQPTQTEIRCQCDCNSVLQQHHISVYSQEKGTIQLENNTNIWIGVVNTTNGTDYVISDCPFDYCIEESINITLSSSHDIDRQCAHNRSGVLCGECQQGFSLVFGSSNCRQCSNFFFLLLILFSLAGIALVAIILFLNITIATGTVHGLIFYANIIAANKATFAPFSNFLTVFISWVNLDLGIETCFYNGMSSQIKVLLQLVFPAYLFLLIFVIIIVSKYSSLFAKLLSTRNPVAALGTLILLSHSKLIQFIIVALQYRVLNYPDDEQEIVWLYDGNVQYFDLEHIPRLVAAAIILTAGGLFSLVLFFGQWLPHCSNWKLLKWTKNTKYIAFMDAYHSPFTPKHRYWLGLLLFALIAQNLISAVFPHPVLTAGCLSVGIFAFKLLNNGVYKSRFNDILETLFLLNLVILAIGTQKVEILKNGSQYALANISMSIAFVQFVVIVSYHFYKFILKKNPALQVNLPTNNMMKKRTEKFQHCRYQCEELQKLIEVWDYEPRKIPPGEDDPDHYITPPIVTLATKPDQLREPALDILAPITTEDYRQTSPTPQDNHPSPVTHTVIEVIL